MLSRSIICDCSLNFAPRTTHVCSIPAGLAGSQNRVTAETLFRSCHSHCLPVDVSLRHNSLHVLHFCAFLSPSPSLSLSPQFHEVEDPTVSPEAVATEYVCAEFSDVNIVLKAARHMVRDPH